MNNWRHLLCLMVHEGTSGGPVIDLETGYIFAIILVLTVLKLHKTDGDHFSEKKGVIKSYFCDAFLYLRIICIEIVE